MTRLTNPSSTSDIMSLGFSVLLIFGFLAVVLLIEGLFLVWTDTKSPEVKRIKKRLHMVSIGTTEENTVSLFKQRVLSNIPAIQAFLLKLPRVEQLDRLLLQSGSQQTLASLLTVCLVMWMIGLATSFLLQLPFIGLVLVCGVLTTAPVFRLLWLRSKRLQKIAFQLPDALDLISRSLRAGHGFSAALAMVGKEAQEPISEEFKTTFDEINFGISTQNALANLAIRVPLNDLRYFIVAVVIQLESGGNLAELLSMLSKLIRERFKLFGKIRVLAAEGKMSAYILTALPFFVAGVTELLNPKYLNVLVTDPMGIKMVIGAIGMMIFGGFVMWRIIDIRV
jgi:tight adherence protein B